MLAEHEEHFSRVKFDASFPKRALEWVTSNLEEKNLSVYFYEDPKLKRQRLIRQFATSNDAKPIQADIIKKIQLTRRSYFKNHIKLELQKLSIEPKIKFIEHHKSHAAAAFFSSNFQNSAVLVIDGVGEKISTSIWTTQNNELRLIKKWNFPNSIGLFYAFFSAYCGFKVNSGEYKFMGLSPYGKPIYKQIIIEEFLDIKFGDYQMQHKRMGLENFQGFDFSFAESLFGVKVRLATENLTEFHACIAASVQAVLNDLLENLATYSLKITNNTKLCIGGGVGLNCVSNYVVGKIIGESNLHVFSASGDAGGSFGAAALGFIEENYMKSSVNPVRFDVSFSKIGRYFPPPQVKNLLIELDLPFIQVTEFQASEFLAQRISEGAIIGIFSGPAEFGPRALGNRSIIADPRIKGGQITINKKIKFRESFRPFAPIVLEERAEDMFEMQNASPFMLRTVKVKNYNKLTYLESKGLDQPIDIALAISAIDSPIPSVTHIDGSARVQTISSKDNSFVRKLLEDFYEITSCPTLINTSFNVRGEPMVSSPYDAVNCFMTTGLDYLYLEGHMLIKKDMSSLMMKRFQSKLAED